MLTDPTSLMNPAPLVLSVEQRLNVAHLLAERAARLLGQLADLQPGQVAIYALPRPERLILVVDPGALRGLSVPPRFVERLTETLGGRRVAVHRSEGLFLQIEYYPTRLARLEPAPLDLSRQPSPLHVPVGMTARGPLWLSVLEMDSVLVGGARRLGKTTLLHAWILALLQGKQALLVLWDGKNGTEFARYAGPHAIVADDLQAALSQVQGEVAHREQLFRSKQVTSLGQYNALPGVSALPPIVLVFDELADLPEPAEQVLIGLVRRAGAYGVHPVVGIQRPDAGVMKGQLKANLTTRFALPVASLEDSRLILGRTGAEKLPKLKGRLLFVWNARLVEAQAFTVILPPARALPANRGLLSERERRLVETARSLDGWFRVREIAEQLGESHRYVNDVAQRWELIGYLTPTQVEPKTGRRLGRRATALLYQACGSGGCVDQVDQAGFGARWAGPDPQPGSAAG